MYYTKYPVYARIYSIYTASETTKAGSFVSDMYSWGLCDIWNAS